MVCGGLLDSEEGEKKRQELVKIEAREHLIKEQRVLSDIQRLLIKCII